MDSILAMDQLFTLAGLLGAGHVNLPIQSTCALWTWRKLMTVAPGESCGGYCGEYGVVGTCHSVLVQSESCVRILSTKSNTFSVGVGLRQGCPLSPLLFCDFHGPG